MATLIYGVLNFWYTKARGQQMSEGDKADVHAVAELSAQTLQFLKSWWRR